MYIFAPFILPCHCDQRQQFPSSAQGFPLHRSTFDGRRGPLDWIDGEEFQGSCGSRLEGIEANCVLSEFGEFTFKDFGQFRD